MYPLIVMALVLFGAVPALAGDISLPVDPGVSQDAIGETICVEPEWSRTHRPPWRVTNAIKRRLLADAGLPPESIRDFELDHQVPIDLGGSSELANLRLQPWPEAREKDRVETCLARSVCAGRVPLAEAQTAIWNDWRSAARLCQ